MLTTIHYDLGRSTFGRLMSYEEYHWRLFIGGFIWFVASLLAWW